MTAAVFGTVDWGAVGAVAGVAGVLIVIGGAVVGVGKNWMGDRRLGRRRIELLEIRLFGLPPDPVTGAKKLDGEFDRIDKRLDALPGEIIEALRTGTGIE
jgi:hypothetical protein